ncbi:CbtB domain-containing protein [Pseudonocardia acaciae]|uniref:CbtB domain-containing protein n=1 Tax=Pseudonocardia acaciae TaxID=551276 RepID=UPI000490407A|nr:CbtB domain-containing protein [Pseudonocardia acaciae]
MTSHAFGQPGASSAGAGSRPVPLSVSGALPWLLGALVFGLALYYLVGIDEGATSVFGNTMAVHELMHDARHFLGFPCH